MHNWTQRSTGDTEMPHLYLLGCSNCKLGQSDSPDREATIKETRSLRNPRQGFRITFEQPKFAVSLSRSFPWRQRKCLLYHNHVAWQWGPCSRMLLASHQYNGNLSIALQMMAILPFWRLSARVHAGRVRRTREGVMIHLGPFSFDLSLSLSLSLSF